MCERSHRTSTPVAGLFRLTNWTTASSSQGYSYDLSGNRSTHTIGASSYTYTTASTSNRLSATTGPSPAHQALARCAERCRTRHWVLEVDIKSYFDTVRHDLIIKALEHHEMPRWVVLYRQRWLQAPMVQTRDEQDAPIRTLGTPQGGVISPLLANLFLHYAFDQWMDQ